MTVTQPRLPRPQILLCESDHERLMDVVCASAAATPGVALLWREVVRATVAPDAEAPADLVRVHARVRYRDLISGADREVTLHYPTEPAPANGVSVDTELGAALVGLSPGDVFGWADADDRLRLIRVDAVRPPDPSQLPIERAPA